MIEKNPTIGEVLTEATAFKGAKFRKEDLPRVDAAFARWNATRPSDDIAECSAALLKLLHH